MLRLSRVLVVALVSLLGACLSMPAVSAAYPVANLYLLDAASTGARCLDGTPAGFYFQAALSAEGNSSWVIHLQGGGECATQASCYSRLGTASGSSKYFTPTVGLGLLNSPDPAENPALYDANHVWLPYCQGDLWSGTVTEAGEATWGLYFAGHLTVLATVDALQHDFGLVDAPSTRVILAGDSAGGIGTWLNADSLVDTRLPSTQLSIASFAGFYFTATPYTGPDATQSLLANFTAEGLNYNVHLWSSFVDQSCAEGHEAAGLDPSLCLLANNSFPFISVPAFAFESLSDMVQLTAHDSVPNAPLLCNATEQAYVAEWRSQMTAALAPFATPEDSRHGVFAPACWTHVFLDGPVIDHSTAMQAYTAWFNQDSQPPARYKIIDSCIGNFCNPSCTNPCAQPERIAIG